MIVNNLDIDCIFAFPAKADAPLVIDAYAPLASSVTFQCFQPITWWHAQLLNRKRNINLIKFAQRDIRNS
jgi:hypothetical protein